MSSRRTSAVAALAVVALLASGACGSGGDEDRGGGYRGPASAATDTDTETDGDATAMVVAEEYLTAFAAGPDAEAMAALSAPGSVAERYAVHTGALAEVQPEAGEETEPGAVRVDGDEIVVTLTGASGADVDTTWADFEVDDDGRLVSFTIDGEALDDRLIIDGDRAETAGVTATVVSAFELVTNDSPVVVIEIENGARRPYRLRQASYEGQTVVPDGPVALAVAPGATERTSLIFGSAPLGATLTLTGDLGGAGGTPVEHELSLSP